MGTGLISLPLAVAGIRMVGIDLSPAMLGKLVEKGGGHPPFPLVIGDAVGLPFVDDAFGAALARHVLHLIPDWRSVLSEIARVVVPGGVLLINLGGGSPRGDQALGGRALRGLRSDPRATVPERLARLRPGGNLLVLTATRDRRRSVSLLPSPSRGVANEEEP